MLSYTGLRNLFGSLSNDKGSTNLTLGDTLINQFAKITSKKFNFLEASRYSSTVASQQFYSLPNNFGKLKTITITVGSTKYFPILITSREQWDKINASTTTTSNIPQYCFIFGGEIGFYPMPSSATTNGIYIQYHKKFFDLSIADYTTGTINSIANGSTTITGNATSWTVKMAGRWIMIADSNTSNTGDGVWYEIDSITSATELELKKPYEGISISSGTASYTIGQCSYLPEDFQILPVFEALEVFFTSVKPDANKLTVYKTKVKEMKAELMAEHGSTSISPVISEEIYNQPNPNNYIQPAS